MSGKHIGRSWPLDGAGRRRGKKSVRVENFLVGCYTERLFSLNVRCCMNEQESD